LYLLISFDSDYSFLSVANRCNVTQVIGTG